MTKQVTRRKAKKGGEVSPVNGKFYKGGWFMPDHGKGKTTSKKISKGRRVEIEPYKWVDAKNGYESLYQKIGIYSDKNMEINLTAVKFYGVDANLIQNLINHYKFGYRWIMWNGCQPIVRENGEYIVAN